MSGIPKLPFYLATALEIVCLLIINGFLFFKRQFRVKKSFNDFRDIIIGVLTGIAIVDILVAIGRYRSMYIAVFIRPLIMIVSIETVR